MVDPATVDIFSFSLLLQGNLRKCLWRSTFVSEKHDDRRAWVFLPPHEGKNRNVKAGRLDGIQQSVTKCM